MRGIQRNDDIKIGGLAPSLLAIIASNLHVEVATVAVVSISLWRSQDDTLTVIQTDAEYATVLVHLAMKRTKSSNLFVKGLVASAVMFADRLVRKAV